MECKGINVCKLCAMYKAGIRPHFQCVNILTQTAQMKTTCVIKLTAGRIEGYRGERGGSLVVCMTPKDIMQ